MADYKSIKNCTFFAEKIINRTSYKLNKDKLSISCKFQLFGTPLYIWDPRDLLGPPGPIWDPRDLFGTPTTIRGPMTYLRPLDCQGGFGAIIHALSLS